MLLTGGESRIEAGPGPGAIVDWLTVTFLPESAGSLSWKADGDDDDADERSVVAPAHLACDLWPVVSDWLGGSVVGHESAARYGYAFGCEFSVIAFGSLVPVGRVDWGGERHGGRGRLDISGAGCGRVSDWGLVRSFIEGLEAAKITRVDLAVDCLAGEFGVEDARSWYELGEFHAGGRVPRHSCPGDWFNPAYRGGEGICYGRTLEVGRRENGKMLRAYEKGRQLGDSESPWTRFEVELRNIDRDIPFDVLTERDRYFAGAYECLKRVLPVAGERIKTHQADGEIALSQYVKHANAGYGQVVSVLRAKMSAGQVLDLLCREGLPRRLQKSSLTAFHLIGAGALQSQEHLQ